MTGMNILLQIVKTISRFDKENLVEWTRSLNDILYIF